jgi:hypothetical protein
MTTELESQIGSTLKGATLPAAPEHLRTMLRELPAEQVGPARRAPMRRIVLAFVAVLAIAAIGVIGLSGGGSVQPSGTASPSPNPTSRVVGPPIGDSVDGLVVRSVGQVLDRRASGAIKGEPVELGGYWTDRTIVHSCAVPVTQPGVLDLGCHDIEFGITERNEPILTFLETDQILPAAGPYLNPYVPEELQHSLFSLPVIDDQRYPPVPIVVVGHFDDPRANECRPQARAACLDRFVIDRIVSFDPSSVPAPTATPAR